MFSMNKSANFEKLKTYKAQPFSEENLRSSLIQRAHKLKDKLIQQTNNHDYSLSKLTNQTLEQIKKYKKDFQQNQQFFQQNQPNQEKLVQKKQQLKKVLLQNLQKCKVLYVKNVKSIKQKRNRMNTLTNGSKKREKSFENMLTNLKQKIKNEHSESKKRDKSIPQFLKANNLDLNTYLQEKTKKKTHFTQKILMKFNKKLLELQNQKQIIQRPRNQKNLHEKSQQNLIGEIQIKDISHRRFNATQIINTPQMDLKQKKQIGSNFRYASKKNHPNSYWKGKTYKEISKQENRKDLYFAEKSLFIPLGKGCLQNQRKKLQLSMQILNTPTNQDSQRYKNSNEIKSEVENNAEEIVIQNKDSEISLNKSCNFQERKFQILPKCSKQLKSTKQSIRKGEPILKTCKPIIYKKKMNETKIRFFTQQRRQFSLEPQNSKQVYMQSESQKQRKTTNRKKGIKLKSKNSNSQVIVFKEETQNPLKYQNSHQTNKIFGNNQSLDHQYNPYSLIRIDDDIMGQLSKRSSKKLELHQIQQQASQSLRSTFYNKKNNNLTRKQLMTCYKKQSYEKIPDSPERNTFYEKKHENKGSKKDILGLTVMGNNIRMVSWLKKMQ